MRAALRRVRGHGGSDTPAGPYTLEQMSTDLFELLDSLGIAETHFVGVSMGEDADVFLGALLDFLSRN